MLLLLFAPVFDENGLKLSGIKQCVAEGKICFDNCNWIRLLFVFSESVNGNCGNVDNVGNSVNGEDNICWWVVIVGCANDIILGTGIGNDYSCETFG